MHTTWPGAGYSTIDVAVSDCAATITMNRPERKNSMTMRMVTETYDALCDIARRTDIRLVTLTGAGNWFSPGGDIQAIVNGEADDEVAAGYRMEIFQVPVLLHEMPQVTVAVINGPCAAAGLGWALACDLRLATESAVFATAFLDRGIAGDMSVPWTLPRVVGAARARQLSFLPEKIDAQRALSIGLVDQVFADEDFDASVAAIVDRLLGFDPVALRTLKAHYVAAERMQFADYAEYESRIAVASVDRTKFGKFFDARGAE